MFSIGGMKAPTVTGNFNAGGLGGLFGQVGQMQQTPVLPGGGPNMPQPVPQPDPTANAALLGAGYAPAQYQRPMTLPSGGPNVHQVQPPTPPVSTGTPQVSGPMPMPFKPQIADPTPRQPVNDTGYGNFGLNRGPGGNQYNNPQPQPSFDMSGMMDIFNRPMPTMPEMPVPNPISYGSFMPQQFSFMNNRTAPPMPFNGMMKGMFGIR